ncbi:hypothetical protein [Alistipes senegalensis]|uniref:hypothetical protein n=1 Tax=Alistipes senegalensis TaxID=1288121 RepID=UPI00267062CB|nr:hypothetical protein [Alistipes senegalensis]
MQEREQKISPIKQRILQFADTLNVSKREFYLQIGVSRGTLESKTGITEDVLAKFIAAYPNVSIEWLMQGKGDMLVSESEDKNKNSVTERSHIQELIQIIQNQAKALLEQQQFINAHFPKAMRDQISTPPLSDVEKSPDIEHIKD